RAGAEPVDTHERHEKPRRRGERRRDEHERRVTEIVVEPRAEVLRELGAAVVEGHEEREERRLDPLRARLGGEVEQGELGDHADTAEDGDVLKGGGRAQVEGISYGDIDA